jgi:PBSX family phage terminase large subunit
MNEILSNKQLQFIAESTKKVNLAHGSVRSGKTVGTLFRFMQACYECPDSQIWMIGHTASTIYDNAIRLILEPRPLGENDPLAVFRPFCTWLRGDRELRFKDKRISTVGAKDGGAIGAIQGKTMSLAYCDEMTLYPEAIIDMVFTRLSNPHSKLFASMNPSHPSHKLKKWIDGAKAGDPNFYELHFTLEDNPYLDQDYKDMLKSSLSGVFYRRNYLGEWCLAEGAIFDFFDRSVYVVRKPPRAAEYWIVGIDYGVNNAFAAVLVGINTGKTTQSSPISWVESEYYWDSVKQGRQKTNSELVDDLKRWLEPYAVKSVYIDPSAAAFRLEMQRAGLRPVNADNDVINGIQKLSSELKKGSLFICQNCENLIREVEGYVWNPKSLENGEDEPLKQNDHAVDALRYAVYSHKISTFDQDAYNRQVEDKMRKLYYERGGFYR